MAGMTRLLNSLATRHSPLATHADIMTGLIRWLNKTGFNIFVNGIALAVVFLANLSSANSQDKTPAKPEVTPAASPSVASPPAANAPVEVKPSSDPAAPGESKPNDEATLAEDQAAIKEQFRRFDKAMLDMAEFIRKTEPERADILIRAINNSKESGVFRDMEDLVKLLASEDQLGDAVERQGEVVDELQELLNILMSDDREKELAREKARIEQYIKDLTKIIAGQKDVRAATDRGETPQGLTPRQEKLAEKTAELKKLIEDEDKKAKEQAQSEEQKDPAKPGEDTKNDPSEKKTDDGKPSETKPKGDMPQETKPGETKPEDPKPGEEKPGEQKPGEKKPGEDKPGEKKPDQKPMKPGPMPDSEKPMDPKSGKPMPSDPKPGEQQPSEKKPGESEESDMPPSDSSPPPPSEKKQAREKLENAKKAMEKAIKKLEKELKKDASKNQEEALEELQKAKEKLEEILRQIREQEKLLQLATMEARFQRMLAQQIAIYNDTVQIDKVPEKERTNTHQLKSEELSQQESELVTDANKALTLMQEEGTAVAFPEAVEQMRFDMQTLVAHLKQQQVGSLTQTIEMDVINGLKEMIDALQEEQEKEKEKQDKKDQPPQEGEGGEEADDELLKQISELKMLKSLQIRINNRTMKIAQTYTGEQATKPEIVQQVRELSIRQARIQKATYDLATGKNK